MYLSLELSGFTRWPQSGEIKDFPGLAEQYSQAVATTLGMEKFWLDRNGRVFPQPVLVRWKEEDRVILEVRLCKINRVISVPDHKCTEENADEGFLKHLFILCRREIWITTEDFNFNSIRWRLCAALKYKKKKEKIYIRTFFELSKNCI